MRPPPLNPRLRLAEWVYILQTVIYNEDHIPYGDSKSYMLFKHVERYGVVLIFP